MTAAMPPAEVDHEAAAEARLRQWAKDRPNILSLLAALNAQSQELETALQDLIADRFLDAAAADQLDTIGDIVGQVRVGEDDATYRQRIKARIRLNRSSSTPEDILAVMRVALVSLTPQDPSFVLSLEYADFRLTIVERQTPTLAAVMLGFLREARAAGVRGVLEWWESEPAVMFQLDAGPGLDQGFLAGASD